MADESGLDDDSLFLIYLFAASVGSFFLIHLILVCASRHEIPFIIRHVYWLRFVVLLLWLGHAVQLYFELEVEQRVIWPSMGVWRPVVGLLLTPVGLFVNSHVAIRWIVSTSHCSSPFRWRSLRLVHLQSPPQLCVCKQAAATPDPLSLMPPMTKWSRPSHQTIHSTPQAVATPEPPSPETKNHSAPTDSTIPGQEANTARCEAHPHPHPHPQALFPQLAFLVSDAFTYAYLRVILDWCEETGPCGGEDEYDTDELTILSWRAAIAGGLEVWASMIILAILVSAGCCKNRYPPRLLESARVSHLPASYYAKPRKDARRASGVEKPVARRDPIARKDPEVEDHAMGALESKKTE